MLQLYRTKPRKLWDGSKKFSNPNVFLNSTLEWTVYFDTESELEAVVGVEFLGNKPNQLVIGD